MGFPAAASVALPEMPRGSETILVIEDDVVVQKIASRILKTCGYQVLSAADGKQAFDLCRQHAGNVHLALIDLVTPTMFGREVAEWLKRIKPALKVLFMSGYPGFEVIERRLLTPDDAFLSKPFTPEVLALKTREVLGSGSFPAAV